MAKATVQAALGPVVLRKMRNNPDSSDDMLKNAEIMLMICILSIVVTAPIGAIIISITGPKLLTKTKALPPAEGTPLFVDPINVSCISHFTVLNVVFCLFLFALATGWRRSHRPSLYDISIIDEKEEREDPELQTENDEKTAENTNSNANKPLYTITK